MKKLIVALLVVLFASGAVAQTAPKWVANDPTGAPTAVKIFTTTPGDLPIRLLEVSTSTSAVTFSVWGVRFIVRGGVTIPTWKKLSPQFGHAASDTLIEIDTLTTKAYTFPIAGDEEGYLPALIWLQSGTAKFQGE